MTYTDIISASLISSSITGIIGFFAQRYFKNKDDVKTKRNDIIIKETIANEDKLFKEINSIFKAISPLPIDFESSANEINTLRRDNRLYISDKIYYMCAEVSDYLLAAAVDRSLIDKTQEQRFIHKFKDEFTK